MVKLDISRKNNYRSYSLSILLGLILLTVAILTLPQGENLPPGVLFPANYANAFTHYATVQRSDGTVRNLYISSHTLDKLMPNSDSLPNYTTIVIEGYYAQEDDSGEYKFELGGTYIQGEPFEMIHVIEKRSSWIASDFTVTNRIGDWNFGSFSSANGELFEEDMSDCFNCHNATSQTDFIYSLRLLKSFARTGMVQHSFCNLPNRLSCE